MFILNKKPVRTYITDLTESLDEKEETKKAQQESETKAPTPNATNNNSAKKSPVENSVKVRGVSQQQPSKRRPEKELNHLNWDEKEEPEEKGEFTKASDEQMKDRKVLTAKRKAVSNLTF